MKLFIKISIGVLSLLTIAIVLIHYWLRTAPEGVDSIEDALATPDLAFIGLVDHQKIKSIMDVVQGEEDPMPIPVPWVEQNLIDKLFGGSANLAENLQHTLVAIHAHPEQGINVSLFLQGKIEQAAVQATLTEYFDVTESDQGRFTLISNEKPTLNTGSGNEDNFECPGTHKTLSTPAPKQPIFAKYLKQGLLITLNEHYLDEFTNRLATGKPAVTDLTDWNNYKQGKLISFMAKKPHESATAAKGLGGMMLKGISEQNAEITKIAGSAAVDLLSFNLKLDLTSYANSQWAEEKATAGNRKLAEYVSQADEYSESLARLVNNARLYSKNDALIAQLSLPFNFISKLGDVVAEAMASLISVGSPGEENQVVEEEIIENPWDYSEQMKLATLVDLPKEDDFFRPNYQQGPFAFSVETVELDQAVLSLALSARAQFKKLEHERGAKGYQAKFNVVSVKDKKGNELLRDERCITLEPSYVSKNHKPDSGFVGQNRYQFNKKVRLIESAGLNDIDRIVLQMDLSVDTGIKVFELPAKPGQEIEFQATRLFISKVNGHTINYLLSGNEEAMLELRALNQDKLPLRSSGGFGIGDLKSRDFKGEIKYIQAFFAQSKQEVKKDFDFNFDQLIRRAEVEPVVFPASIPKPVSKGFFQNSPPIKGKNFTSEKGRSGWSSNKVEHKRGAVYKGPVKLELYHNYEEQWSFKPQLRIYYPFTDELVTNLNGIQLIVEGKNGAQHIFYDEFYVGRAARDGESWLVPRFTVGNGKYEAKDIELDGLDLSSGEQLDVLEGEVNFRLPQKVVETRFEMPGVGESIQLTNSTLTLTKVSFGGIPRISFSVKGGFQNILNIIALNDKNEQIRYAQIYRNQENLGISFDNRADIREFVVYSAAAVENVSYPFKIVPEY